MSRGKELIKNTAIIAIGKFCTKFLSFFLLPFYMRLPEAVTKRLFIYPI